jgi:predicted nucleotidyltransferase
VQKIPIRLPKSKIEKFCKKYHIVYLALFGSILTSRFSEESDIDILVKFDKKHIPHLLGIVRMESELTSIMGREVDLKTPNDLSRYFRDDVLAHAMIIYGK